MIDLSHVFGELSGHYLILAGVLVGVGVVRSAWFKGVVGETLVQVAIRLCLPSKTYRALHDVTLPTPDGSTQVDHIIVSRFGVFVVETKNMKGWIFGSAKQSQWTQKFSRRSFRFQNPLRQNWKHVKTLEVALDVPADTIQSVVVFVGGSTLKTPMPANVTHGIAFVRYVRSFREPVLSESQVNDAVMTIESGRFAPSRTTSRYHRQTLRNRGAPEEPRLCPRCGANMALRTAKRGPDRGQQFWGCSSYPDCRMTQALD